MKEDDLLKVQVFGLVLVPYIVIAPPHYGPGGFVKGLVQKHVPGDAATGKRAEVFTREDFERMYTIIH